MEGQKKNIDVAPGLVPGWAGDKPLEEDHPLEGDHPPRYVLAEGK